MRFFDHTRLDTPKSVGLLWTRDRPVAETSIRPHSQETDIPDPKGFEPAIPASNSSRPLGSAKLVVQPLSTQFLTPRQF